MVEKRVFTENEKRIVAAVARSLQWAHSERTMGEGRKWEALDADDRKLWLLLARRAMSKFDSLREAEAGGQPAGKDGDEA